MSETQEPTASEILSEFAPKLTSLTQEVLFGDVWEREELPKRDRSLATISALVAGGNAEQLVSHLRLAKRNGLTESEIKEVIIHLAFYAGWPRAMSAMLVAKRIFDEEPAFQRAEPTSLTQRLSAMNSMRCRVVNTLRSTTT